ncbi:vesicle coat component [Coniosporium tulheliwenetii]|uniref:Vesicle coat component n=1 Tax=Coniosporium tulheliwenetii TaxID=3383036 RepID=A0ACC2Z2B2_9PEZI|nr:vesicle coat component [Cladosporium sp. JES 115]
MDSESGVPDFSYAYGGASWNPALRPEAEGHPTPEPPSELEELPSAASLGAKGHTGSGPATEQDEIPVRHNALDRLDAQHAVYKEPTSDDDFFDRYGAPAYDLPAAHPASVHQATHSGVLGTTGGGDQPSWMDDTGPPPIDQGVVMESESPENEDIAAVASRHPFNSSPPVAEPADEEAEPLPEENYEHQGETTLLEDAVNEDVTEPLFDHTDERDVAPGATGAHSAEDSLSPKETSDSDPEISEPTADREVLDPGISGRQATSTAGRMGWGYSDDATDLGGNLGQQRDLDQNRLHSVEDDTAARESGLLQGESKPPAVDWDQFGDDEFDFTSGAVQAQNGPQPTQLDSTILPGHDTDAPLASIEIDPSMQPSTEQDLDAMWKAALEDDELLTDETIAANPGVFFFDDGEGFLQEGADMPVQQDGNELLPTAGVNGSSTMSMDKYTPVATQQAAPAVTNPYLPQSPQFSDFSKTDQRSATSKTQTSAYGAYSNAAYGQPSPYQQQQARPATGSAQSFADKAKGGYHSPYDLPEDISKPRRRAPVHTAPIIQPTPPPPRSSSMQSNMSAGPPRPQAPPVSNMSATTLSPPSSSHSAQAPTTASAYDTGTIRRTTQATPKPSASDFFADLPIVSKPRPSGRYTPQVTAPTPPQSQGPPPLPPNHASSFNVPAQQMQPLTPPSIPQFQPPERLPAFPDRPSVLPRATTLPAPPQVPRQYSPAPPAAPAVNARYSPAPPAVPSAGPRYSPAPPPGPTPSTHNRYTAEPVAPPRPAPQPFAPRTSSPLAYHTTPQQRPQPPSVSRSVSVPDARLAAAGMQSVDNRTAAIMEESLDEVGELHQPAQVTSPSAASMHYKADAPSKSMTPPPPPPKSGPPSAASSPRKQSKYAPQHQPSIPSSEPGFAPPRRSQTQSPGATMKRPKLTGLIPIERPASVHGPTSPTSAAAVPAIPQTLPHRRGFSQDISFITPTDERAQDPLERWKGCPIFRWGLGGTVVTTFPKQIPRYGAGHAGPMIKCSPGEVKLQSAKDFSPFDEKLAKFPGPLKAKGKKKDVITWLKTSIESMEKDLQSSILHSPMPADALKRYEEKILLWKVMQLLVEHDGHLEGNDAVQQAVRKVLSPESEKAEVATDAFATGAQLVGMAPTTGPQVQADPVDPRALDELRTYLAKGDRKGAVWHAVDQRLWAHAMLISSTLERDVWKQVAQEFVRQEVKKLGDNTQPLAALYEIFAGNLEESIDQLVPASARAGFQMVSKAEGIGSTKNTLEGLDRWRETLVLVLNNRSESDVTAILTLGKLLAGYGRIEAAHICYLFARSIVYLGGADDPQSNMVLIGADHVHQPFDFSRGMEAILLTEVYEFTLVLSSAAPAIPHLQAYKLHHATVLASYGYRNEAQQYCDAIAAAFKSTTRMSPYYHPSLVVALDDLSRRLSQSPQTDGNSWISKPSVNKASGWAMAKFNSFIAGDESDAASTGSGGAAGAEAGPFAKVAGGTPTISRNTSGTDLYGSYPGGSGVKMSPPSTTTAGNSRYAPGGGAYTPRTSLDHPSSSRYAPGGAHAYQPSRPSVESQRSNDGVQRRGSGLGLTMQRRSESPELQPTQSSTYLPSPQYSPPRRSLQPQQQGGMHSSSTRADTSPLRAEYGSPYMPTPPVEEAPHLAGSEGHTPQDYQPQHSDHGLAASSFDSPAASYEPPTPSYEPPSSSYDPPSYQPYEPEPPQADTHASDGDSPAQTKKKSFMDDDDDDELERRAAELKKQQKAQADREADEAFRKAAEADAAKDAPKKPTSSWFGWLKKSEATDAPNKPIKAKLGEENSFVYDPDLKKWVNKKAGTAAATPTAATPPPPKGPPCHALQAAALLLAQCPRQVHRAN